MGRVNSIDGGRYLGVWIAGNERPSPAQLVEHTAQRPHVSTLIVLLSIHHLGSHVLEGTGACLWSRCGGALSRNPEVTDLDDTLLCKEDVLRLDIAVNDALRVDILQTAETLQQQNADHALGNETRAIAEERNEASQIPATRVLQHRVQVVVFDETPLALDHILVIQLHKQGTLRIRACDHAHLSHSHLVDVIRGFGNVPEIREMRPLHSKQLVRRFLPHELNRSTRSTPQCTHNAVLIHNHGMD